MSRILIFLIKLYQKYISPMKSVPTCRFRPTCSQYAIEALKEWGFLAGTGLAIWRVLRCNPFGKGGYDPVPLRKKHRHETVGAAEPTPTHEPDADE